MTAPLMPVPLSALDLTFVGQYAEVEVIGCDVVRGGISDVKHVREHSGCSTRLYVGGHQLRLYDDLTTLRVAAPVDPCDHTPLLEGPADAPSEVRAEAQDDRPAAPTPAAAAHVEQPVPATAGRARLRRRVLRWSPQLHAVTGPLITAFAAAALFLFGAYVAVVAPRLSGGTLLGLTLMAIATFVIARLLEILGRRQGATG